MGNFSITFNKKYIFALRRFGCFFFLLSQRYFISTKKETWLDLGLLCHSFPALEHVHFCINISRLDHKSGFVCDLTCGRFCSNLGMIAVQITRLSKSRLLNKDFLAIASQEAQMNLTSSLRSRTFPDSRFFCCFSSASDISYTQNLE